MCNGGKDALENIDIDLINNMKWISKIQSKSHTHVRRKVFNSINVISSFHIQRICLFHSFAHMLARRRKIGMIFSVGTFPMPEMSCLTAQSVSRAITIFSLFSLFLLFWFMDPLFVRFWRFKCHTGSFIKVNCA